MTIQKFFSYINILKSRLKIIKAKKLILHPNFAGGPRKPKYDYCLAKIEKVSKADFVRAFKTLVENSCERIKNFKMSSLKTRKSK